MLLYRPMGETPREDRRFARPSIARVRFARSYGANSACPRHEIEDRICTCRTRLGEFERGPPIKEWKCAREITARCFNAAAIAAHSRIDSLTDLVEPLAHVARAIPAGISVAPVSGLRNDPADRNALARDFDQTSSGSGHQVMGDSVGKRCVVNTGGIIHPKERCEMLRPRWSIHLLARGSCYLPIRFWSRCSKL